MRRSTVAVRDLAVQLHANEVTIRRDLEEMERAGYLKRIHGGAQRQTVYEPEPPVLQRQFWQVQEKQAIALTAAELISDGDVVAIESVSTGIELAHVIAERTWQNLQVVTNGFRIAEQLLGLPGVLLVFVGGIGLREELGTFGILAEEMLKLVSIKKLFVGCRGIDPKTGLSNDGQASIEIGTVRAFAAASNEVFVLADHTKFNQRFLVQVLPISEVDVVVTDSLTPEAQLDELRSRVKQVLVAPINRSSGQKEQSQIPLRLSSKV
jgi:DeoR family fructose operon transcriptional repressor